MRKPGLIRYQLITVQYYAWCLATWRLAGGSSHNDNEQVSPKDASFRSWRVYQKVRNKEKPRFQRSGFYYSISTEESVRVTNLSLFRARQEDDRAINDNKRKIGEPTGALANANIYSLNYNRQNVRFLRVRQLGYTVRVRVTRTNRMPGLGHVDQSGTVWWSRGGFCYSLHKEVCFRLYYVTNITLHNCNDVRVEWWMMLGDVGQQVLKWCNVCWGEIRSEFVFHITK